MEELFKDILEALRAAGTVDQGTLKRLIFKHNEGKQDNRDHLSKKLILPYYLRVKEEDPQRWASWDIQPQEEEELIRALQQKPMRTASGVATITVITPPRACSSDCRYCPNDLRMPKSYLHDEPACQRAEQHFFDPYLQVASRLQQLIGMGHPTDKVELIVLGGTWCDYPEPYQYWFISQLFRALNDEGAQQAATIARLQERYGEEGWSNDREARAAWVSELQAQVDAGSLSYNQAISRLYPGTPSWQQAGLGELLEQHAINETAAHRAVGLVVETRPDTIDPDKLRLLRTLGCTKIQVGVQSLDEKLLKANDRVIDGDTIARSFALLRLFGFKIHAHFMLNLLGAAPEDDKADYARFVSDPAFLPDEVKLYPCALVKSARLVRDFEEGRWRPYTEEELLQVLCADILATPAYVRVSRMIRDIGSHDIMVGNKKTNLRQMVEARLEEQGMADRIQEIRYREIGNKQVDVSALGLDIVPYETQVSQELFLQWVTPENRITGFLRLSLPRVAYVSQHLGELPVGPGDAMIRELHVYGRATELARTGDSAQHRGLGKHLVETAADIARQAGYQRLLVISSVGTREYYRRLGFVATEDGLYQQLNL